MGEKKKTMEEISPSRGGFRGRGGPRGRGGFEGRGGRGGIRGRGGMDSRGRGGMMRGRGGERGGFGGPPRGRGAPGGIYKNNIKSQYSLRQEGGRGGGGRFQRRGVGGMGSRGSGDFSSRQEGRGGGRFQRGGRGGDRGGSRPMDRSSYGPGSGPRPKRGRFDSAQPGANGYNHPQSQYPGYDSQPTNYPAASSSATYGSRDGYSSTGAGTDARYADQGYGQPSAYEQPRHSDVYETGPNPYVQSGVGYAANVSSGSGAYDSVDYQNYNAPQTADTRGYVPQQAAYPNQNDTYSTSAYSKTVPPPQVRGGEAYGSGGGAGYSSNTTASYDDRGYPTTYDSSNYGGYGKADYGSNYGHSQRRY